MPTTDPDLRCTAAEHTTDWLLAIERHVRETYPDDIYWVATALRYSPVVPSMSSLLNGGILVSAAPGANEGHMVYIHGMRPSMARDAQGVRLVSIKVESGLEKALEIVADLTRRIFALNAP